MKAVGIICEYNPFHNGHKHQIEQAKELSGCDAAVCVMSGSFVQRGEVAVFDKWHRAESALKNGADLVIELPVWYVLQSAEVFARGGIELLNAMGVIDAISFGSETADEEALKQCARFLTEKNPPLKERIEKYMKEGEGYPSALRRAVEFLRPELGKILESPNDMLGVSYISAMINCGADFRIVPVKRHMAQHGSEAVAGEFASSTAIRSALGRGEEVSYLMPDSAHGDMYTMKNIEQQILFYYRINEPSKFAYIPGLEPGFENRLIKAVHGAWSLDEFYKGCVGKRYTLSRVKRTVLAGLLDLRKGKSADYIRVLGMTDKGAALIKEAKEKSALPFVVKTADFRPGKNSTFKYDILATDLAAMCCENADKRTAGADYYTSPVRV